MTQVAAAEEAIVTISEKIQGTESLERCVEALLTQEKSPRSVWAMWMGAELEQMHTDVWDKCRDQTYDVIRRMKARSNAIRQWEWQQQPGQSAQPAQPALPDVSYLGPSTSAPPSLQWQEQQSQQSYVNHNIPSQTQSSAFNPYSNPAQQPTSTRSSINTARLEFF